MTDWSKDIENAEAHLDIAEREVMTGENMVHPGKPTDPEGSGASALISIAASLVAIAKMLDQGRR